MLIIEGPDGGGKSTLVHKLSHDLRIPVAPKVVGSNTQPLVALKSWTEDNLGKGFQEMIFDRHRLISEPIYAPAMTRTPQPEYCDFGWMYEMTALLYGLRPIIIYCLPAPHVVLANVSDESTDNEIILPVIEQIYAGYVSRAALDCTRGGIARIYNYKTTRYDDLVGWVARQLQERLSHVAAGSPRFPRQSDSEAVDRGPRSTARRYRG